MSRAVDFLRVKRHGQRFRANHLTLAFLSGSTSRLGLISMRSVGRAVDRNRLKRVIRELFRCHRADFPMGDIVVIFAPRSGKCTNQAIRNNFWMALKRLNQYLNTTGSL